MALLLLKQRMLPQEELDAFWENFKSVKKISSDDVPISEKSIIKYKNSRHTEDQTWRELSMLVKQSPKVIMLNVGNIEPSLVTHLKNHHGESVKFWYKMAFSNHQTKAEMISTMNDYRDCIIFLGCKNVTKKNLSEVHSLVTSAKKKIPTLEIVIDDIYEKDTLLAKILHEEGFGLALPDERAIGKIF